MRAYTLSIVLGVLVACGGSRTPDPDSGSIGPAGGVVTLSSGPGQGASVTIPPGALADPVAITIAVGDAAVGLPAGITAVGPAIVLGPEGQTFLSPVTVTVPATSAATGMFTRPLSATTWTEVPDATYAAGPATVTGQSTHFSIFVATSGKLVSPLHSIAVGGQLSSLTVGAHEALTATGTLVTGTTRDVTSKVTWHSSDPTVATIDAAGVITALKVGTTTITATDAASGVAGMLAFSVVTFNQATGFDGNVNAILAAPDGSGDIYVGGSFGSYRGMSSPGLVRLHSDGSIATSFSVGTGFLNVIVYALAAAPGGAGDLLNSANDIYVGGEFLTYNGTNSPGIVRLQPTGAINTGFVVGAGFDSATYALMTARDGTGDLYVGGIFQNYAGTPSRGIARLHSNGAIKTTDFTVGSGFASQSTSPDVRSFAPDGTSDIYVGGFFDHYNGVACPGLTRLHGDGTIDAAFGDAAAATAFKAIDGSPGAAEVVYAIVPGAGGTLVIGGAFQSHSDPGSASVGNNIAQLDHSGTLATGLAVGAGANGAVNCVAAAADASGDLYVGGFFSGYDVDGMGGGTFFEDLIRLNSTGTPDTVFDVGTNFHYSSAFEVYALLPIADGTGDVYVGGSFGTYGSTAVDYLVRMSPAGTLR